MTVFGGREWRRQYLASGADIDSFRVTSRYVVDLQLEVSFGGMEYVMKSQFLESDFSFYVLCFAGGKMDIQMFAVSPRFETRLCD